MKMSKMPKIVKNSQNIPKRPKCEKHAQSPKCQQQKMWKTPKMSKTPKRPGRLAPQSKVLSYLFWSCWDLVGQAYIVYITCTRVEAFPRDVSGKSLAFSRFQCSRDSCWPIGYSDSASFICSLEALLLRGAFLWMIPLAIKDDLNFDLSELNIFLR